MEKEFNEASDKMSLLMKHIYPTIYGVVIEKARVPVIEAWITHEEEEEE